MDRTVLDQWTLQSTHELKGLSPSKDGPGSLGLTPRGGSVVVVVLRVLGEQGGSLESWCVETEPFRPRRCGGVVFHSGGEQGGGAVA